MPFPLVFLGGLGLRLTISTRRVVRLSLVFVFVPILELSISVVLVFLDQQQMISWAFGIDFRGSER